ncbi:MAG TPA: PQQ-binding-like beta-propeller repeat protein [Polyangiaceae bacterium]
MFGSLARRLGLLGIVAFAGCADMRSGAHPDQPPFIQRPNGALTVLYDRRVLAPSRISGEPYERGQAELDLRGQRVFVGSSDHGLYAVRAEDGTVLWRFETLGFVQCAPLYEPGEDVVYFGSNDGALYKVAASNGKLLWRFMTNAEVARRPVLSGGLLYATNANDTVLALEPNTGKLRWHQHRTPATGMEVAGHAGVSVFRGKIYSGFSDGTVAAFDPLTGVERWAPVDLAAEVEAQTGEAPTYLDVDTTPVPDTIHAGPVVYVASYAGGVFALDAETGTQVWSNPGVLGVSDVVVWSQPAHPARPGEGKPAGHAARKLLLAASGTSGLWALDPETGTEVWRRALPSGGVSAPVPIEGALLVSTTRLGLFLLSPIGGELIDGIHMPDGSSMTPAAAGTRAFVLTNGGTLLSVRVAPPGLVITEPNRIAL